VAEAHDTPNDPVPRPAQTAKPAVEEHVVAIGYGKPVLVVQSFRGPFDQGEKSLASGRNVRTVLNVVRRPETLRSGVVPLVEKRVESLQHESLVLFLDCLGHLILLRFTLPRLSVP